MLRLFSAAWLFFGLTISLAGRGVEEGIQGYKAAAPASCGLTEG
jgi:hypothetical protein